MYILAILLFLQTSGSQKVPNILPPTVTTMKHEPGQPQTGETPNLHSTRTSTAPLLHINSDAEIHAQMERDIGGQAEAIGELKSEVSTLKDYRENKDRPDIDSLKDSRLYAGWVIAWLVLGAGGLWWAKGFLWRDTIRPWLRNALREEPSDPAPPSISTST